MEHIKSTLSEARAMVDRVLVAGIAVRDIPELGEMIRGITAVESYVWPDKVAVTHADDSAMDETTWLLRRIDSELQSTEIYCGKWLETKDVAYKTIAREDLKHSEQLINLAQQKLSKPEDKAKLQEAIKSHSVLLAKLA